MIFACVGRRVDAVVTYAVELALDVAFGKPDFDIGEYISSTTPTSPPPSFDAAEVGVVD